MLKLHIFLKKSLLCGLSKYNEIYFTRIELHDGVLLFQLQESELILQIPLPVENGGVGEARRASQSVLQVKVWENR